MTLKQALLVGAAFALPVAAQAQPVTGFYVGAGAGINWQQDADITLDAAQGALGGGRSGTASFNADMVGVISLGYGYGNGFRGEVELSVRHHDGDSLTGFGNPAAGFSTTGNARTYGFMLNGFYDFDLGMPVVPYVGLGVGALINNFKAMQQSNAAGTNLTRIDGGEWTFGYQAIVGASLPLNDVAPGLSLTAEYRFLGGLSVDQESVRRVPGGSVVGSAEVESLYNHSLLLGIRYAFNVPPPPAPAPAPAAAPAPARTFLVFFDFDRADLTDRARQIIAEAATNAQRVGTTRIEIAGHADRAGTPQYNQRLSERRANAVAAELERRGVARSAMVVQAFGESRPLVPTADGVREPQNRRVEIVLR
jgi:outer membrane protein OmpA-like peptidoglycan-associated protein